jgi:hypothetical protein
MLPSHFATLSTGPSWLLQCTSTHFHPHGQPHLAQAQVLWGAGIREPAELTQLLERMQSAGMATTDHGGVCVRSFVKTRITPVLHQF